MSDAEGNIEAVVENTGVDTGTYRIRGVLNAQTVSRVEDTSFVADAEGRVRIDLSGVKVADSTAVALMLGWLQQIRDSGASVQFDGVSERLRALIEIAGLTSTFALSP